MFNDAFVLRRTDFSIEPERESLRDAFRQFLTKECSAERVRLNEPAGYDAQLWKQLQALRPVQLGVAEASGGDGGGLIELALVAEELGRVAAPVPFVETVVAARLLARIDDDAARNLLPALLDGELATLHVGPVRADGTSLTPSGAVADHVLGLTGDDLVIATSANHPAVENLSSAPLAWRDLAGGTVIASGTEASNAYAEALNDWRVLTAAAVVGFGESACGHGIQYAKDRTAFGVPIATFQAIANPLVDAAIGIAGARRLVHKAAWFIDNEPDELAALVPMAFAYAAASAERAGATAVHTQGGFGFTNESDVQLFYRRAKGWPLLAGGEQRSLDLIADACFGPVA